MPNAHACRRLRAGRAMAAALVWLSAFGCMAAPEAQEDAEVSTVLHGLQHREGLIRSVRGYLAEAAYTAQQRPTVFQVEFVVADGKVRWSAVAVVDGPNVWNLAPGAKGPLVHLPGLPEPTPAELPRTEMASNGQVKMEYSNLTAVLEITAADSAPPVVARDPFCEALMLGIVGRPWSEHLSRGLSADNTGVTHAEGQDRGADCELISMPRLASDAEFEWGLRLWVSAEMGYAVTRAESTARDNGTGELARAEIYEALGLHEVAPDVWLPGETRNYSYRYNQGLANPCIFVRRTVLFGLQANGPVTDADFELRVPVGAAVSNPAGLELPAGLKEVGTVARELAQARPPEPDGGPVVPDAGGLP